MEEIKILELFGGIGALTKAFKRQGIPHKVVDYVEIDKYAVASYNAINGTNFEPQDICAWDKDIEVDLIMHGSPCQDFSLAGKQAGGDEGSGTRSSLMYETIRIVKKLKPKYVIWENVKNLISKKHRHNFDAYLETMSSLGYTNYYQVLNAKDYGIPQNRERVFTISILGDDDYEFPIGENSENKIKVVGNYMPSGHDASRIVDENGLAPTVKENHGTVTAVLQRFEFPKENTQECEIINPIRGISGKSWQFEQNVYSENSILRSLKAGGGSGNIPKVIEHFEFPEKQELQLKLKDMLEDEVDEKYYLSSELKKKLEHKLLNEEKVKENDMIRHSYTVSRIEKEFHTENSRNNNISATLTTRPDTLGIVVENKICETRYDEGLRFFKDDICGTIRTIDAGGNKAIVNNPPLRIRKLTPKECWRLMGFDDADFERASQFNSNAQLYKQAGNSIVVNVLEAIITNLLLTEPNKNKWSDLD